MACLRCGSAWTTRKGKDMVSCPECCKQQRCKARKQGRLPTSETKTCERCGQQFDAVGGNAILLSRHCATCKPLARSEYLAKRKAEIATGQRNVKPQNKRPARECVRCGKKLKKDQSKFCGNECFAEARKDGSQPWDRTNQLESVWHRGGLWASAPSRKPVREILTSFQSFMRSLNRMYRKATESMRPCKVCGCPCGKRLCSDECRQANADKVAANERAARKRYRKTAGKHFKQRAKRYGVEYVRFPKTLVFERDNYICQLCKTPVLDAARYRKSDGKIHMKSPTIDHIIPMSKGGPHTPDNCQTACFGCNSKKGSRRIGQLRLALR